MDKDTGLLSWAQPLPQLVPLSKCDFLEAQAWGMAFAAAEDFEGAPQSAVNPAARTGISGKAPDREQLRRWARGHGRCGWRKGETLRFSFCDNGADGDGQALGGATPQADWVAIHFAHKGFILQPGMPD
jgi:hypothetical protein